MVQYLLCGVALACRQGGKQILGLASQVVEVRA
jgi:hypothetical protein